MTSQEEVEQLRSEVSKLKNRFNLLVFLLIPFARKFGLITAAQENQLRNEI